MLRHRVIPTILIDGFSVLKTINFSQRRNLGSPITAVRTYNTRNVDELLILDIDASKDKRSIDIWIIKDLSEDCFMPLTVGGGIRTLKDIESCLMNGADKVVINSEALINPSFISEASKRFGSQCIVVSIDVSKKKNQYTVYSHSGIKDLPPLDVLVRKVSENGAGEILLNNVDLDGSLAGPDVTVIKEVAEITNIPVIATGGISCPEDCPKVIRSGASAVSAASIFHFTGYTPNDCKVAMHAEGIPVRLDGCPKKSRELASRDNVSTPQL